jgi:para-aminobenzoate synthetase component 1
MRPIIEEAPAARFQPRPEDLVASLGAGEGVFLVRGGEVRSSRARYSFVGCDPFLVFESKGPTCTVTSRTRVELYGNPWQILAELIARYELPDEIDWPFPLGGAFGFWGYDLKNFVEPKLARRAVDDLELPDCAVGFHSSLAVFDHWLGKTWIISTGLNEEGTRSQTRAREEATQWRDRFARCVPAEISGTRGFPQIESNVSRSQFLGVVERAQEYIRAGDIYQVNLSHRLSAHWNKRGWDLFLRLKEVSPAPFSGYFNRGDFELCSSSPEQFLRMSGSQIETRPIKGTRPRDPDPTRDAQLSYELQTSAKETAELVMITDLLRNDLGRVCEFGSVHVPDLMRLEKFPQVQHLVSTVAGRLKARETHLSAFASCFPGGSITGAPKIRAMEIIDELEPVSRGPYTGAFGYLGFNRESQWSILIRTAIRKGNRAYFQVGAGIVADSIPEFEYDETIAKGRGFVEALKAEAFTVRAARAAI